MKIPDNIDKYDILAAIDRWIIGENAERDRAILIDRLVNGLHYEPLAEKYDLSVRYTKTIVYKWETKIFKHINK